jgi:hypothetical protein
LPVVLYGCETWSLALREETEGIWEQISEDIWTKEGWGVRKLEKTALRGASWFVFFAKHNQNNQVEEDEMRGLCSTNGG